MKMEHQGADAACSWWSRLTWMRMQLDLNQHRAFNAHTLEPGENRCGRCRCSLNWMKMKQSGADAACIWWNRLTLMQMQLDMSQNRAVGCMCSLNMVKKVTLRHMQLEVNTKGSPECRCSLNMVNTDHLNADAAWVRSTWITLLQMQLGCGAHWSS